MRIKTIEGTRLRVADDITQLVGETPLLQFKKLVPSGSAEIYAKLEYLNPGGSVKDRAAIGIIQRAEEQGLLKAGGHRRSNRGKHGNRAGVDWSESRL